MAMIKFDAVSKTYISSHLGRKTAVEALRGFSLSVDKGEIFAILGLNGAGKTTAIKMLLGLIFPTTGKVSVGGLDPAANEAKKIIGYLPELPYFPPYLTARQALSFYGKLSGIDGKHIGALADETLDMVGLSSKKNALLKSFSKGMLQKLGLAQAVIHNPQVILLDEPVSGLDPIAVMEFRTLLTDLGKKGKTIFLSSHSISEVEKMCSRAAVISHGKLCEVFESKDWANNGGGLEKLFLEAVKK